MPVTTTYPGVYIDEQKSGSHVITGVSTSVTAFVGASRKGPSDTPVTVTSFADYVRTFGDVIDTDQPMGHSVGQFFANGGSRAIIVRTLGGGSAQASVLLAAQGGLQIKLTARSGGAWANGLGLGSSGQTGLFYEIQAGTQNSTDHFNLIITEYAAGVGLVTQESWTELSMCPHNLRYVFSVLAGSSLVTAAQVSPSTAAPVAGKSTGATAVSGSLPISGMSLRISVDQGPSTDYLLFPTEAPGTAHTVSDIAAEIQARVGTIQALVNGSGKMVLTSNTTTADSAVVVGLIGVNDASEPFGLGVGRGGAETSGSTANVPQPIGKTPLAGGLDGTSPPSAADIVTTAGHGMDALNTLDFPRFNILVLPGVNASNVTEITKAMAYCGTQNAFLVVDPAAARNDTQIQADANLIRAMGAHGALYWPRIVTADSGPDGFGASGAVAGIMARTDASRGVWKAPAGLEAGVGGALGLITPTNDTISGELNPLGINVLRTFPGAGMVVWGARTLAGSDVVQSDSKYVPVRRLTDYLEASLYLGTQFAVFEPNDPVLWGQLRLAVGGFMRNLFRQGAFQQSEKRAESDSFFVICDSTVNPQSEIDSGRVNVVVGFAPLKPAEFVVVTITQISQAGE